MSTLLLLGAAAAVVLGAVYLTSAALVALESLVDPAAGMAIVGAVWGISGLAYFYAARRRG